MLAELIAPDAPPGLTPLEAPPTFSVLICVYQMAHLIGEALDSILAQTVPPHEIIVCDDGSTDGLDHVLAAYRDRIVIVRQEHKGLPTAHNLALAHATGEFVLACDADDIQFPRMIELTGQAAMRRPDLDIIGRGMMVQIFGRPEGLVLTPSRTPFPLVDQRQGIIANNVLFACSAVRRQSFIDVGGCDESMICASDYDMWLRLILSGCRAGLIPEPLGIYRFGKESMSSNEVASKSGRLYALRKLLNRDDLSVSERELVEDRIRFVAGEVRRAEARAATKAAVLSGRGARQKCLRLAFARGQLPRTRVKSAAAAIAPRLAARRMA